MTTTLTMQGALLALTDYWAAHGCVIAQPSNVEVGAGTLNSSTFLRVLGPEPWKVAYVEPSVRPDDARYGQNPNRVQCHTQFQVILKPEPGNAQDLYLGSLEAIGVDTRRHDIRFVEDNWASPALGSWGLGWEVWLDGLEITQFTYFQQAGAQNLDPVSVELTYGMERILMALQGATHFKDIVFAPGLTYGEIFGQGEYEWSRYYLDDADVAATRTLFSAHSAEAARLVAAGLPIPAHAQLLKCSHLFNILDSRGVVSTTERADAFKTMRGLARQVASLWMDTRAEAGHPLIAAAAATSTPEETGPARTEAPPAAETGGRRHLLFEIGVEEMPPAEVGASARTVEQKIRDGLAAAWLAHGQIIVHAAPRRIIAEVSDIADREPDRTVAVKGPRVQAAFDADGRPTRAAQGFARSQGVDVADLARTVEGGTEHLAVQRVEPGRSATEVLTPLLAATVAELRSAKNMKWNAPGLTFTRPIRWLLALLDDAVLPVEVSTLAAGRTTRLHRAARPDTLEVAHAAGYIGLIAHHGILADTDERRATIRTQAAELAATVEGSVDFQGEAALLEQITNLVEQPTVILGSFDSDYLKLPAEILTTVMRKHQRYLPVRGNDGALLPYFLTAANGPIDTDLVRTGNQDVLRARYEDALFFYRADLGTKPEEMHARLERLTFADRLGSMAERARRIEALAQRLASQTGVTATHRQPLARAASLAKFDLGSQMVTEMTSLAGTMAGIYARAADEGDEVADALAEMELPRPSGGVLPQTVAGALLAVADRLDLLAGLFAADAAPTGSSDPYGMRRAAIGLVAILTDHPHLRGLELAQALQSAFEIQPIAAGEGVHDTAYAFILQRVERTFADQGYSVDLVRAVLPLAGRPSVAQRTLNELAELSGNADFGLLAATMQRIRHIVPAGTGPATRVSRPEAADEALAQALQESALAEGQLPLSEVTAASLPMINAVTTFFEEVLVNAEDPETRRERLGLLTSADQLVSRHSPIDWSALPKDLRTAT